jgi:Phosphotransferase enzyme family
MARRRVHEPHAVAAACRVAAACGYPSLSPVVLSNTVVWLRPHQVIGKVGKWTHSFEALAREHRVATPLAHDGGPVAQPLSGSSPEVDHETGFVVTLWNRLEHDREDAVDPEDIGRSLRELHVSLSRITDVLPSFQVSLDLARPVLHDDGAMSVLPPADRSLLREAFDRLREDATKHRWRERPIHGEAHDGNVLITPPSDSDGSTSKAPASARWNGTWPSSHRRLRPPSRTWTMNSSRRSGC